MAACRDAPLALRGLRCRLRVGELDINARTVALAELAQLLECRGQGRATQRLERVSPDGQRERSIAGSFRHRAHTLGVCPTTRGAVLRQLVD